jgi:hypothetical protein
MERKYLTQQKAEGEKGENEFGMNQIGLNFLPTFLPGSHVLYYLTPCWTLRL